MSPHATSGPVDLILHGGAIYTTDKLRSWVEAMAIRDGRIVAIGRDDDVRALAGPGAKETNLRGKMVIPGIIDVHNHHMSGGQAALYETTFSPMLTLEAILDMVRERAASSAPGKWIYGGIWGSHLMSKLAAAAALKALDAASDGHPVMLRDDSNHNRWVNSRAMELIGITSQTRDPADGRIVRDADSHEPTGLLFEKASALAEKAVLDSVANQAGRAINAARRAVQILNGYGITGFQDAAAGLPVLEALKQLDANGELSAWCVASLPAQPSIFGEDIYGDALVARREEFRSAHVRPDFVKIFMDGVPPSRTAAMIEPYVPDLALGCCFRGEAKMSVPELARMIAKYEAQGFGVKIHCAGDGAVRVTLDAIDVVRSFNGPGRVHHIAHASFIDPADVPRFKELNVVADLSPIIWYPGPIVAAIREVVPKDRAERFWPNRDLLEAGALMAAGSDWPVMPQPDPWLGIEGMVTRQNPKGEFPGALWPEQALDLATVLEIYTINSARAMGMDGITGSLETGKSADFAILDRKLFETPASDLADTKILATYFEGRPVFEQA
ncbi:MAG: amidohydrolase [Stellaceae bacterium]